MAALAQSGPSEPTAVERRAGIALVMVALACLVGGVGGAGNMKTAILGGAVGTVLLAGALVVRRPFLPWDRVLMVLVLVILFIPLRRYKFPGDAGISLEPYRLLVALIVAGWLGALLVDSRVRVRKSGIDGTLACILLVVVGSVLTNPERAGPLQSEVLKAVTFLASFMVVFYVVVSVVRTQSAIDLLAKTLVMGGAIIGLLAIVESRTGFSPFAYVDKVIPILVGDPSFESGLGRGSATRTVGPAEHPIALSAVLVMLIPLGVYVTRVSSSKWYFAVAAITLGVLSTVSRTGIMMLLTLLIVFFWLRTAEMKRMWPLLLPVILVTQIAMPGTLGSLKESFFPEGGLVGQQSALAGDCASSGRVADIGPTLAEVAKKPFLGYGYGTRVISGPSSNACILDNQWLGTTYEVGYFGLVAWLLLFTRVARRFGRGSKYDDSPAGWLQVAVTASVTAYAVGSVTFDALGFSQVTFVLFLILGLAAAARMNAREADAAAQSTPIRGRGDSARRTARRLPRLASPPPRVTSAWDSPPSTTPSRSKKATWADR
ncbi:O-antigen ligase family protein [Solirubrobacter sp. CPCC 204708]|uniref:O-antigen ligase family protein n=1 Tax=Solirubrobacter deserti TaxID=2282478 RepID=A0ABT4RIS3_9ACTN|nr:O-antigen ligase family protein [Solirubrobacter deserti]MBE2320234.1 O-antigen ligase family protein [Solirubrobacter deserti]MDA0138380.1 O-antigen ligase family protein [Solirubrobacter deserti]